jgi:glycogen operon protein
MTDATWNAPHARCLGAMLVGDAIAEVDERGEPIHDDTLLILSNAGVTSVAFTLPAVQPGQAWELVLDTNGGGLVADAGTAVPAYQLGARSLAVLRLC